MPLKFLYIALVFVFSSSCILAQNKLHSITVNPLNRALIVIDGPVSNFKSELSSDKMAINLILHKSSLGNLKFPIRSNGVISTITASSQNSNFLTLQIKLTDKRGYSAFFLPMSNSICVEVFDWSRLTQSEDNYRSALLALEEGLYPSAKSYLEQSVSKEQPNSAAILGIINMMEGNIDEALKNLHVASENNSNIPDAYSALAQYYSSKNDQQKVNHYKNLYRQHSGLNFYKPIIIGSLKPERISDNDSLSFLSYGVANDTAQTASVSTDSMDTLTKTTKITPMNRKNENYKDSSWTDYLYQWISPTLFYVVFGIAILMIMIISSYLKWRKQQIAILNQMSDTIQDKQATKNSKFKSELNKAESKPQAPHQIAINKYKANDNAVQQNSTIKNSNIQNKFSDTFPENSEQVQDLARIILENQNNAKSNNSLLPKGFEKSKNPNLDLALSLQKKQQNLKSKNIEKLNSDDIKSGNDDELSKKFGVPTSAIDAKKKISKLQSDQDELNKLAGKFKQK